MILFVWRWTAKKKARTGAKPCAMPVSKDVARYVRVCELRPDADNDAVFTCCASSSTVVCDVNRVGLFLHTDQFHRGMDGLKIHLSNKSAQAVRQAHLWTDWPEHLMNVDDFRSAKGHGVGDLADAPKHLGGLPPKKRQRRANKTTPLPDVQIIDDDIDEDDEKKPSGDADAKPSEVEKKSLKPTKNKLMKKLHQKAADEIGKQKKEKKTILVPWSVLVV